MKSMPRPSLATPAVRLWECGTGRCLATWDLDAPIAGLAFRPAGAEGPVLAVAAGCAVRVFCATVRGFTPPGADADAISAALAAVRDTPGGGEGGAGATWRPCASTGGVRIDHQAEVSHVSWHARGAYLLSVCPGGLSRSVVVHHLPKGASQCPFRKNRGVVRAALFHPSKPFLFVATDRHVRVYNLTSQVPRGRLCSAALLHAGGTPPGTPRCLLRRAWPRSSCWAGRATCFPWTCTPRETTWPSA